MTGVAGRPSHAESLRVAAPLIREYEGGFDSPFRDYKYQIGRDLMCNGRMSRYRKLSLPLLLIAIALALASCGGSVAQAKAATVQQKLLSAHPCTGTGYYAQCVGSQLAAPKASSSSGGPGFDFAWGGPPGYTAYHNGVWFGASYLSDSSKDWSYALVQSYVKYGRGVVFVWESSASRSLDGFNAGYDDAYNATHEANRLGFKTGHINYASDFDTSNYGSAFVGYYQGAAAWDRRAGFTTGAYGGLHTILTLCDDHVTTLNWQTIAWSGGEWASTACAPLRQTSINNDWAGYSVDYDRAMAANYGQSNYKAPPPPDPHHYLYFYTGPFHSAQFGNLNERSVVEHYDGARLHVKKYKAYLGKLRNELRFLAGRDARVANADRVHHKPSWGLFHRGFRYQGLIHRSQGKKLVSGG